MDTITAISTSLQEAAIAIVRMSGKNSLEIAESIFRGKSLIENNRMMLYGHIIDNEKIIDEVMICYLKAPYTYTKEDMVEIHCHGGSVSPVNILEILLSKGARLAEKGEFTKRAFLNGRIDLTQAESVMDLISAKTNLSFDLAIDHLEGGITKKIQSIMDKILELLAGISLSIDYPEEDEKEEHIIDIKTVLKSSIDDLNILIDDSKKGRLIEEGVKSAIIGRPNVGKSSILNYLSREDRAIVTPIAGTTRDTLEQYILINDIKFLLIDTAGIRDTDDEIEKIGVERSKKTFNEADIVIAVFSSDEELNKEDKEILSLIKNRKHIVVINKTDKNSVIDIDYIEKACNKKNIVYTSVKDDKGLDDLEKKMYNSALEGEKLPQRPLINSLRQIQHIKEAKSNLEEAIIAVNENLAYDYIEVDIKLAYESLQKVLGIGSIDIVNEVFSRFCVGK